MADYTLETHLEHRIECLEAEVRTFRQALRILADHIIEGRESSILPTAQRCKELLNDDAF